MGLTATVGLGLACLLQSLKVEKRNALRQKLLMRIMSTASKNDTKGLEYAISEWRQHLSDLGRLSSASLRVRVENEEEMIQVLLNNLDVFDLNRVFKRSDHTITTILQVAVDAGNLDHITRLLENGADPNLQGRQDTTPLITAIDADQLAIVELLLKFKADPNLARRSDGAAPLHVSMPKDEISSKLLSVKGVAVNISTQSGDTPLHLALTERSTAALIRLGAKVNVRNNAGESPLMCACKRGVLPVVDLLLRAGADPLMPDGEGATALHAAAGNVECLKLLLDAKPSDLNIKITGTASERQGMTPLHVAIAVACQDSALALLDAGADATITLKDQPLLELACSASMPEVAKRLVARGIGSNNPRALLTACEAALPEIVRLLLAGGLDPATTFANNVTALHAAVSNKEGSVEVVKLLLEKNSSKEFIETRQTDSGRTALHVAAEENCPEIATLLVSHGASVEAETDNEKTPLLAACARGDLEVVAALVEECKASTTAVTVNGQTGLHLAILRAHIKLSKGLIKLGFDVNIADKEGKTPLDLAYEKKLEPVIVELKNAGAAHRAYLTPKSNRSIASTQRSGVSKSQ